MGLEGPCETISTACSSSAKAFASAERLIRLGLADAAVVGGVDTLCGCVLFGFSSLDLVSPAPCRPFDAQRDGISLGEAAGFALLERADAGSAAAPQLLGYGEASDAHHMSTPHPQGLGAERALPNYNTMGLAKASLEASVRYMAESLGPKGMRVNGISAGPIKTLAASGIKGFGKMLAAVAEVAPIRRNVTIDEVGNVAAFLLSDLASGVSAEITYVDGGFSQVVGGMDE